MMNELPDVRPWDQAKTYTLLANVASLINLAAPAPMSSPNRVVMALWKTSKSFAKLATRSIVVKPFLPSLLCHSPHFRDEEDLT